VHRLILLFTLSLSVALPSQAATTKYVIDHILITMRSGMGSEFQILRTLPSGTALEILQTNDDTGYSLARSVKSGVEGWVLTQYLSDTPIHRDRLVVAEKKIAALEKENNRLKKSAGKLGKQSTTKEKESKDLLSKNEKLSKELAILKNVSIDPLKFAEENKKLKTESMSIDKEINMLRQENQALKDRSEKEWLLTGAGILFAGIVFGFIFPKIRSTRKSGYDSSL